MPTGTFAATSPSPAARRGVPGERSTRTNLTGLAEAPSFSGGESPTLPHLVTQEKAKKYERNDESSGQRLAGASTCLHAAILAPSLGPVERRCSELRSSVRTVEARLRPEPGSIPPTREHRVGEPGACSR